MPERAEELFRRRSWLKWSQAKLAAKADVSFSTYVWLEVGRLSPQCKDGRWRAIVRALAKFYDVAPEVLFPNAGWWFFGHRCASSQPNRHLRRRRLRRKTSQAAVARATPW